MFGGNWPNSIFASMDPIAIDSVAFDFLAEEWPSEVLNSRYGDGGAQDYLHEAALASNPLSGTFYDPAGTGTRLKSLGVHEHWNNAIDKQYSRNLGKSEGIELVPVDFSTAEPQPNPRMCANVEANKLILHAADLEPGESYVLERVNIETGATQQVSTFTTETYGQQLEAAFNATSGAAFYRIRQQ